MVSGRPGKTLLALSVLKASGLSLSPDSLQFQGRAAAEIGRPVGNPMPADIASWSQGAKTTAAGELIRTEVRSLVGDYNLSIAAYSRWEDATVSGSLLQGRGWETNHIWKLCQVYRSHGNAGNILDVGANIGTFTIPLADCLHGAADRAAHSGKVIAVEAMPPTLDHLAVGILQNNLTNVQVYNYAVGAASDPKKVTMSLNPVNKGGSSVKGNKPYTEMDDKELQDFFHPGKNAHKYAKKVIVEEFNVELTTGDLMLKNNPGMKAILVAKVDIEGHEGHFFEGSQLLFSKYPPCFMTVELIPEWLERAGTPVRKILDMLISWDYRYVPTYEDLTGHFTESHTRTVEQIDMQKCLRRVREYANAQ